MNTQILMKWTLLFIIYSFIGWVWETCYVFVRTGHYENRGLLWGPFLPVYGFGALLILITTAPVQKNWLLIFIIGMLSASIAEYIGGSFLELVFHTREWDYSESFMNLHGHICLLCSVVWGFFSIALVKWLHPWISSLLQKIPPTLYAWATILLSLFFVIDFSILIQRSF